MVKNEHFSLPSSNGRSRLSGRIWMPEGRPKMVLQLAHGMIEYVDRYEEFAIELASRGAAVAGCDHLGHGRTAAGPEEFGYFAEEKGWVYLVKDLHRTRKVLERKYPGVPYFMMGHSMGSFMLRRYLTVHGNGLKGAVLMGTGNQPRPAVLAGLALSSLFSVLLGADYRSDGVNRVWRWNFNRKFRPLETSMYWLSTEEEQVKKFIKDPYCGFQFSFSAYRDLLQMVYDGEDLRLARRIPSRLPVLLISGGSDPVGQEGKGVLSAAELLDRAGVRRTKVILYPGLRHELVMEKNRKEVAEDIYQWMTSCLAGSDKE